MNKDLYKDESSELEAFGRGLADGTHIYRSPKFKKAQLHKLQVGLGMKRPPIWRQTWIAASLSAAAFALVAVFASHPSEPSAPQANRIDPQTAQRVDDIVTPIAVPEAKPPAPKPQVVGAPAHVEEVKPVAEDKRDEEPKSKVRKVVPRVKPNEHKGGGFNLFNFNRNSINNDGWNRDGEDHGGRGRD